MSVRDGAALIVSARFPEVERRVFEDGTVRDQLEFIRWLAPFAWGVPRQALDLRLEQAETAAAVLKQLAEKRFGKPEIVATSLAPQPLLTAASEAGNRV